METRAERWMAALDSAKQYVEQGYGWTDLESFRAIPGEEVPDEVLEFYLYLNAELVEVPGFGVVYNFNADPQEILQEYINFSIEESTYSEVLGEIERLRNNPPMSGWNAALDALQDFIQKQTATRS